MKLGPEGSRSAVKEGAAMRRGSLSAALLLASCLVSRELGLTVCENLAVFIKCQKKSEKLLVKPASRLGIVLWSLLHCVVVVALVLREFGGRQSPLVPVKLC